MRRLTFLPSLLSLAAHQIRAWVSSRTARSSMSVVAAAVPAAGQGREEVLAQLDLALERSGLSLRLAPLERHKAGVGLPTLGDDDLLSRVRSIEKPGEVRLRLVDVDGLHPQSLTKPVD